jgi:hypothetical protein
VSVQVEEPPGSPVFGQGEHALRVGCSALIASAVGIPVLMVFGLAMGFGGFSTGLPALALPLTAGVWWALVFGALLSVRWVADLSTRPARTATAAALVVAVQFMLAYFAHVAVVFIGGMLVIFAFFGTAPSVHHKPRA